MYKEFFGLKEKPFSITPNPRFLYLSDQHKEGLAHLVYGTDESGSFALLTGEVGTGKTTLCRTLLEQAPADINLALILNPLLTPVELLATICDEFNITYPENPQSRKPLFDALNKYLLGVHSRGERSVLIIDEAQNLDIPTLEQIRLLTNLETGEHKLLKIILLGQPELRELLEDSSLTQLAQRVTARYHLPPLNQKETGQYIEHRMSVAGATGEIFDRRAKDELFKQAGGIPRVINVIAERALLGAYANGERKITRPLIRKAMAEVLGRGGKAKLNMPGYLLATSLSMALLALLITGISFFRQDAVIPIETANAAIPIEETVSIEAPISSTNTIANGAMSTAESATSTDTVSTAVVPVSDDLPAEDFAALTVTNDLQSLLDEYGETKIAFGTLFNLWGLPSAVDNEQSSCLIAENNGLACIYENGDLEKLISYNRPAVLELIDDFGKKRMAVALEIEENSITLDFSGNLHSISLTELQERWKGSFALFWRLPPAGSKELQVGMKNQDVMWLAGRLDQLEGLEPTEYGDVFNENLEQRLIQYQYERGINASGKADPITLIKLAGDLDPQQTPTLIR